MSESADLQSALRVATLLQQRNTIDAETASIIGRPAEKEHVGEYMASIFVDIEHNRSAVEAGMFIVYEHRRLNMDRASWAKL